MDWGDASLLILAGVVMGFVNNLAGGGGLIGLTAFELISHLSPMAANAALRPAAIAIGLSGMIGFRTRGLAIPRRAWLYGLAAAPGAVLGGFLAVTLPPWVYRATLLVVVILVGWRQLKTPKHGEAHPPPVYHPARALLLFTLAGVHMGFLQVAVGLMIMLSLTQVLSRDLLAVNTAKMAIVIVTSTLGTATIAIQGHIDWGPSLALAVGCGGGSFLASRWSAAKGHGAIRMVVLAVCALVLFRVVRGLILTL